MTSSILTIYDTYQCMLNFQQAHLFVPFSAPYLKLQNVSESIEPGLQERSIEIASRKLITSTQSDGTSTAPRFSRVQSYMNQATT